MSDREKRQDQPHQIKLADLLWVFLVPTLVGKSIFYYFALMYTQYPGRGYGWGMIASALATAFTIGRFLWKYRNYSE